MIPLVANDYVKEVHGPEVASIDPLPSVFKSFYEESILAAETIYSQKQGKLYLLFSGGTDSEYVLNLLLSLKMDVCPVIIKLNPHYNQHEISYAFDYCQQRNLQPLVVDIDFDQFVYSGRIVELANSMGIGIYHYSATAEVVGKLDGTILLGDGEPYIKLVDGQWNVEINKYEFGIGKYFTDNNIHGTPYFLRYTPEMMISFLSHSRIRNLANNLYPGKLGSNSSKVHVYNDSGFNIPERTKLHGYEIIERSGIANHPNLTCFKHYTEDPAFSVPYFTFMKQAAN